MSFHRPSLGLVFTGKLDLQIRNQPVISPPCIVYAKRTMHLMANTVCFKMLVTKYSSNTSKQVGSTIPDTELYRVDKGLQK